MRKIELRPSHVIILVFTLVVAIGSCAPTADGTREALKPEFKKSHADAFDRWTSKEAPPDTSIVTYVRMEADLVCRMFDRMVKAVPPDQQEALAEELDPEHFCRGPQGFDPTRPPPDPECDWLECPED